MSAATPVPPLRDLGTDAIAVVEKAEGVNGLRELDYVFNGQKIDLGAKGKLTLSYLSGCLTEQLQGGTVTVSLGGSEVANGKRTTNATQDCEAATPIILAEASEAGATVNRVTPFTGGQWAEQIIARSIHRLKCPPIPPQVSQGEASRRPASHAA